MNIARTIIVLAAAALLSCGCWSTLTRVNQVDRPMMSTEYADFMKAEEYMDELAPEVSEDRYRVQPGSRLRIKIIGAGEMSQTVFVGPDGWIDYPYVGEVKLKGKTIPQIKALMSVKLREYYIDPTLVVNLIEEPFLEARNSYVSVFNVSGGGGRLLLRGGENLIDVLSGLRSITPATDWKSVIVYKKYEERKPIMVECNMRKLLIEGDFKQNLPIRNGDIIYVPTEENDWLEEFYASLSVGNSIMGGMVSWRNNMRSLLGPQQWETYFEGY